MPNRDYAVRSKNKSGGNKLLILFIVLLLLLLSGLGLWFLNKTDVDTQKKQNVVQTQQKKELPTRPEEIYSYIRDLETREVPVDKNSKLARLTKEQEQQILKQKEEEKRKQEQQFAVQQPAEVASTTDTATNNATTTEQVVNPQEQTPALTPEQIAEQKAKEKKLAEEKRKQAELKKQQELEKKAELLKQHLEKEREKAKADAAKAEQAKADQTKVDQTKAEQAKQAKVVAKPAQEAPKSVGKYGLQCGAFKSKAQAENMQARLAMAGYNARINSSADWNRVVVGPIGDRSAASAAQSNARSVAECLIVGM